MKAATAIANPTSLIFYFILKKHFEKNDDKNLPQEMEREISRRIRRHPSEEKQECLIEVTLCATNLNQYF